MIGIIRFAGRSRCSDDPRVLRSDARESLEDLLALVPTVQESEVVAHHDDGVEHAEVRLAAPREIAQRDRVRLFQTSLFCDLDRKRRPVDANDIEAAMKIIAGSARSMGVEVK